MKHELVYGTLKTIPKVGIVAICTCGWSSTHFTSLSASAMFQEHQEEMRRKEKQDDR